MFFRNLTLFRFPTATDFSDVDTLLPQVLLKPVGPLEMNSRGFISPFGREEKAVFSHRVGDALWLTVGGEEKILPGAVDCSSSKKGENMMSDIRGLLGSFPAMPLNAEVAPRSILTGWIAGEELPTGLSLGEECEMKDPAEGGAVVKCQHQELRCDEIDKHLDAGKQVTKLALVFEDNLSFVLGDDLIVRKLKFLDGALDQLEHADEDGRRAELDARFVLQSGEVRRLFLLLEQAFKLSKAD